MPPTTTGIHVPVGTSGSTYTPSEGVAKVLWTIPSALRAAFPKAQGEMPTNGEMQAHGETTEWSLVVEAYCTARLHRGTSCTAAHTWDELSRIDRALHDRLGAHESGTINYKRAVINLIGRWIRNIPLQSELRAAIVASKNYDKFNQSRVTSPGRDRRQTWSGPPLSPFPGPPPGPPPAGSQLGPPSPRKGDGHGPRPRPPRQLPPGPPPSTSRENANGGVKHTLGKRAHSGGVRLSHSVSVDSTMRQDRIILDKLKANYVGGVLSLSSIIALHQLPCTDRVQWL